MATSDMTREYEDYLHVLECVQNMRAVEFSQQSVTAPSAYWREELANFDYMFEATPSIVRKLRHHCYHLTGDWVYNYRTNKPKLQFQAKLNALRAVNPTDDCAPGLLISEPRELGGYGHEIDGQLYNLTTLRYYESLIAMELAGLLDPIRNNSERNAVVEIGSGWGGLAYRFKLLFPDTTYFLIDLPETFLFSAVYLKSMFPKAHAILYGELPFEDILIHWREYDFVFLPTFALDDFSVEKIDLAINTASFQEMTTEQVDAYSRKLSELGCKYLYSYNRDRSLYNDELTNVSGIIALYYDIKLIHVLDLQYMQMPSVTAARVAPIMVFLRKTKRILWRWMGRGTTTRQQPLAYKHLKGTLRRSAG